MQQAEDLKKQLSQLDAKGYKAYKNIQGRYDFGHYILDVAYVQGDPFASPSKFMVIVKPEVADFPSKLYSTPVRQQALEDYLLRQFNQAVKQHVKGRRGSGKSGAIFSDQPGQQVLKRSAVKIDQGAVRMLFSVGLPAKGRRVLAQQAITMIYEEIPQLVRSALIYPNLDQSALEKHVDLAEDQHYIRRYIADNNYVAFIANDAILPRKTGVSDLPMTAKRAVPFQAPPELEVTIELPHHGSLRGMALPQGITLIVGGGYHGKSTVLRALERGVYDHISGDGREFVISDPNTVKIRAEDGRRVEKVDISAFISELPGGITTASFSSAEASGSTSQAANIMESLELGARCLLVDEDTSATNFMIRDMRMQQLVSKDKEPITPFIDKIRQLYKEHNVSTVLVIGGSGDYFDIADTVIKMDAYRPVMVTQEAKKIAKKYKTGRRPEGGRKFGPVVDRNPQGDCFDARVGRKGKVKLRAHGTHTLQFGRTRIDLNYLEQLVDESQTNAIGDIIHYAGQYKSYFDGKRHLREVLQQVLADIEKEGIETISGLLGYYALPRIFEIGGAINRYRRLKVTQKRNS